MKNKKDVDLLAKKGVKSLSKRFMSMKDGSGASVYDGENLVVDFVGRGFEGLVSVECGSYKSTFQLNGTKIRKVPVKREITGYEPKDVDIMNGIFSLFDTVNGVKELEDCFKVSMLLGESGKGEGGYSLEY